MQQNSWFLGNLVRVPVFMDMGALITVAWIGLLWGGDLRFKLLAIVAFLVTIVLHELGHALAARARGMTGIRIVISALGGYCSYSGGERPSAGLMISLAGPAVNWLLVVLLWGFFSFLAVDYESAGVVQLGSWWNVMVAAMNRTLPGVGEAGGLLCELAALGLWVNFILGVLNSMPVYPLDGGQAIYRFLQMVTSDGQARRATLSISIGGAVGCVALFSWAFGGPSTFLIILMLFLLYQAWRMLA